MPDSDLSSNGASEPRTAAEWIGRHERLGRYESVGYIGLGESYNRWMYRLRAAHFLRLAARHRIDGAGRVLDVGSGNGFYIGLYRRLGVRDACGVDISPAAMDIARAEYPDYRFEVCDVTSSLPATIQPEAGFDWVSAMDVFFHITEDAFFQAALANCGKAVRSGGVLLVSDNFPLRRLPSGASQSYRTLAEYEAVLRPLGFRLVEVRPVFFLSNGQVGDGGAAFRVMSSYWRAMSRGLGKAIRLWRPGGESLGWFLGGVLAGMDAVLQQQSCVRGFSTKTALFRRA